MSPRRPGALCESFCDRGPCGERYEAEIVWPDDPVVVGTLASIAYRSDKWGDGVTDYEHPVEGREEVLVDRSDRRFQGCTSEGRPARLRSRCPSPVDRLAHCIELTVDRCDGRRHVLRLDGGPGMWRSPELVGYRLSSGRDLLLVLTPHVIVLRGDVRVEPEGLTG